MKRLFLIAIVIALVLVIGSGLWLYFRPKMNTESIVIANSPFEQQALVWIAEDQRLFSQNGLKVTLRKNDTGAGSLIAMLNGEADVTIGVTEFPTVGRVLEKERIRIIGNIAKVEQIYLVGRKDRGIKNISDLKGKKVGTTLGTVAHFYLGRFLELHGLNINDVNLVDVKTPAEWINAVADGDIDAIVTAQPYANSAKERLGANGVIWPAQGGQLIYGLIVSNDKWVKKHQDTAVKLLKSLAQAEDYLIRHPAKAKAIIRRRLNLNAADVKGIWSRDQFSLTLDQSLIEAMEDEARWMIDNKLTGETAVPDFLDYIYADGLKAVKPEAVNLFGK